MTKRATLQSLFFQTSHPAGRIRDARCLIGPLTDLQGTATQIIELFHTQIKGPGIRENLRIEQNFAAQVVANAREEILSQVERGQSPSMKTFTAQSLRDFFPGQLGTQNVRAYLCQKGMEFKLKLIPDTDVTGTV